MFFVFLGVATEKAESAQQHPETKAAIYPAEDNRKKQCNET